MDLNDYAQPQKSLPWQPIALIASGLILLIVVIFMIVRLVQNNRQEDVLIQNGGSVVVTQLEDCEDSANPDACREALVGDIAVSTGDAKMCDLLVSQEDKDNCYWSVARSIQEVKFCADLSVEAQVHRCTDDINEAQAIALEDPALCEQILDSSREDRCQEILAGPLTSENCEDRKPEVCADIELYEQALMFLSPSDCDGIVDESIALSCYDAVEDALAVTQAGLFEDFDEDGLMLGQETEYGTDPENPDTDGDGYTDGGEVTAGYNPNGSGKLD